MGDWVSLFLYMTLINVGEQEEEEVAKILHPGCLLSYKEVEVRDSSFFPILECALQLEITF